MEASFEFLSFAHCNAPAVEACVGNAHGAFAGYIFHPLRIAAVVGVLAVQCVRVFCIALYGCVPLHAYALGDFGGEGYLLAVYLEVGESGVGVPYSDSYASFAKFAVGEAEFAYALAVQLYLCLAVVYAGLQVVPLCGGAIYVDVGNMCPVVLVFADGDFFAVARQAYFVAVEVVGTYAWA